MRRLLLLFISIFLFLANVSSHQYRDTLQMNGGIRFIENKGQWHEQNVLFKANISQGSLFVEKSCLTFVLSHPENSAHNHTDPLSKHQNNQIAKYHAYKVHFQNANLEVDIKSESPNEGYSNYFIGNNPKNWASNVRDFQSLYFKSIYKDIDLRLYSQDNLLKYDFILEPFALPEQITLEYEGLDNIQIKNKNVVLYTSVGEVLELKPVAYQPINGVKVPVEAEYILHKNKLSFKLGKYNPAFQLIIDPLLIFSTYTGSESDNWGYTATYDKKGNVYTGGIVFGNKYPVNVGAYQDLSKGGTCDIGIMKLNSTGTNRLYATYLGGRSSDMPHSMIVNELNELVVYGTTGSNDFPTSENAYERVFKGGNEIEYDGSLQFNLGSDIFVSRFSEDGTNLEASTYIGGTANDGLNYRSEYNSPYIMYAGNDMLYTSYGDGARGELIVDDLNNVYVGSCTFSTDFPTTLNAFQPLFGGEQDGVAFKLDYKLSNLIWSSYLGGEADDAVYSIDVDSEYNLVLTGGTNSTNFPATSNAYKTTYNGGGADAFVTKVAYTGNRILSSAYFGSSEYDQGYFVRTDKEDNVYIAGLTKATGSTLVYNSLNTPLYNIPNSGQFLAKFNSSLSKLEWSTVFGSGDLTEGPDLSLTAFGIDNCGRIYLSGWGRPFCERRGESGNPIPWFTYGTRQLQVTSDAYQSKTDGQDFYFMTLAPNAAALTYATFFGEMHSSENIGGADHVDGGTSRFDKFGTLYQSICASCGKTQQFPIFPSPGAWSASNNSSNCNNAVFRFNIHNDFSVADFILPASGCAPYTVSFQNTGRGDSFEWDFGDGTTSTEKNPTHTFEKGLYTITQIAKTISGCSLTDTIKQQFIVLGNTSYYLPPVYGCSNIPVQIGLPTSHGVNYQWNTSEGLTDSTISNPFAIVAQETLFYMIVSNGVCTDTIYQWVKISNITIDAGSDLNTCISPQMIAPNSLSEEYTYQWSSNSLFTDTLNVPLQDNYVLIYFTAPKYYYLKAIDKVGCFAIDSIYINYQPISTQPSLIQPTCFGLCDGEAFVEPLVNAISPITYTWSTGESSPNSKNLCTGNYSIEVKDGAACSQTQLFTLDKLPIQISTNVEKSECDKRNGSIAIDIDGGTPPYQCLWGNGETTTKIENLASGIYTIIVTDVNNCQVFDTIKVELLSLFDSMKVWADRYEFFEGESTVLHATPIENVIYSWQPLIGLSTPTQANTKVTLTDTITYYLEAIDSYGCIYSDSLTINVTTINCGEPDIFVPNAFTPNGDNKNDLLCITFSEWVTSFYFAIFNRWGEKVFETKDPTTCWDGKYKENNCGQGVYMYTLEVHCQTNKTYKTKGDITLIR